MSMLRRLAGGGRRDVRRYSWTDWQSDMATFAWQGNQYVVQSWGSGSIDRTGERIGGSVQWGRYAYQTNGIVFACILARLLMFAEARFAFRRRVAGRAQDLFTTDALEPLERPWPGGTTGELLARMEQDASLAGNFFAVRQPGAVRNETTIVRLDPARVTIATEPRLSTDGAQIGHRIIGYVYRERPEDRDGVMFAANEVCHYSPIPDPAASYRGMSWLSPLLREVMSDSAATEHKLKFFEHAATPNLVVTLAPEVSAEDFELFMRLMEERHSGAANAYKTLFLGGGADVQVVGKDFEQMDFKAVQGAGETRIAAAAGVPPVIVGLSEGLDAATYSNYAQARRRFADLTMRPLWRIAAASLARLVDVPAGAELWYDDRDIPALREDAEQVAAIRNRDAWTLRVLLDAGYDPDAALQAVITGDMRVLAGQHSGLYSVQLQAPSNDSSDGGDDGSST